MKICFKKNKENEVSVVQIEDEKEIEFKYVNMIKNLIKKEKLEEPITQGEFSDAEVESIRRMTQLINQEVDEFDK
ncbi:MAG: hypothetical protein D8M57_11185 [Candidatus Scalindua sp. AMX11]|nr:MAG: hypothetical protein DWQ00_06710 [Candidatus Scalindua sp.]NOG83448.1 hypothetical protein [Planctomycetota bacterium]RZV72936.1 MAG: hypothetical protein EX341_14020 [Candidatus Scalindua sp. SCAELEC01]TDE64767.1 MAG: hypothetical protein D8M57_11185 [Candidatus Scalindua sp. AMX11]GJQ59852.1 MAG: hypothetical protein SCALA701_26530 [Candidatus Scalindua sp.]